MPGVLEVGPRSRLPASVLTSPSRKSRASPHHPSTLGGKSILPKPHCWIWGKRAAGEIQSKTAGKLFKAHPATKDRGKKKRRQASRRPVKQTPRLPEKQLEPHSLS